MPLPSLDDRQVKRVVNQIAAYISGQRQLHLVAAEPLAPESRAEFSRFFRRATLDSVRTRVLQGEKVQNPPFYSELYGMGFSAGSLPDISAMAAITFVDVVAFHEPITTDVLFHELVHAVQYVLLGLTKFAELYVTGFLNGGSYEEIPLEMHAIALGNRFEADQTKGFSVHDEVQRLLNSGLY